MISDEMIKKVKNIDIKEFLERECGFTFKKETEKYYRCIEHSSLIINVFSNMYIWNSKNEKGDIINWLMCNRNIDFVQAINYLLSTKELTKDILDYETEVKIIEKSIDIKYSKDMSRTYAYLLKTRKLDINIINNFVKKGLLKQDINNNIVFLHKNKENKIVGADLNGTNTYKRFKGVVKNSSSDYGFSYTIGKEVRSMYIFEAPIDLISAYELYKDKLNDCLLLSLGGCKKTHIIQTYLNFYPSIKTLKLCFDNDIAGTNGIIDIKNKYSSYKLNILDCREVLKANNLKDFNELLIKIKNNQIV